MRLRGRLLWSFAYLLLLVVIALAVPLAFNVQRRARGDLEASVARSALVIAASIQQPLRSAEPPAGSVERSGLRNIVASYGRHISARVIVTNAAGTLLVDSDDPTAVEADYSNRPEIAQALQGRHVSAIRYSSDLGQDLLVVAVPVVSGNRITGVVRLSEPTAEVDRLVRRSWLAIAAAGTAVVAAGLAIATAIASSLTRPLRELEGTARRLGSGDLTARASVPEAPPDIAQVAGALNAMATEVEQMVDSQRAFVANASHQIRTPLTGLRLRLETIAREDTPEGRHATAALAEVDRLNALVGDLLQLARAGVPAGDPAPVDLDRAGRDAVERWRETAAEHGHTLRWERPERSGGGTIAAAAEGDVDTIYDTLIENAIVHCPRGARITLRAGSPRSAGSVLTVEDDGPGIAPEDLPHVLERFYRGRTGKATPGTGLGLAIVGEIAHRWRGSVDVDSSSRGTRVTVTLPEPGRPAARASPAQSPRLRA